VKIERVDPEAARHLIAAADAYMAGLYPAESNHFDGLDALRLPNVLFVGAYRQGVIVGCGAVKTLRDDGEYGEIKRVYVEPQHRGRGISKALMEVLEAHLTGAGIRLARLETGIHQPEAIGLYRRLGYRDRAPFGKYAPDPLSLFMEKILPVPVPVPRPGPG
jgi:putative acetyltransferase